MCVCVCVCVLQAMCGTRHSIECQAGQGFYRIPRHSIEYLTVQAFYRMPGCFHNFHISYELGLRPRELS